MADMPERPATVAEMDMPWHVMDRLRLLLERFKENAKVRARNKRLYDKSVADAKKRLNERNAPIIADDNDIVAAIVKILYREPKEFISKYGRELKFEDLGVLKLNNIGPSAEVPRVQGPIVQILLARHGGKKFLRVEWKLDLDALKGANVKLRTILARYKVWIGPHKSITVQLEGDDEPTQIDYRRALRPGKKK